MGLLDWLSRRKQVGLSSGSEQSTIKDERRNPPVSEDNLASCPACGTTVRQTRNDGRCVRCGKQLPDALRASPEPSTESSAPGRRGTLSSIIEDLKSKGYRGPFAIACDSVPSVLLFHGPNVPVKPAWLEPLDNPFKMRVLDCKIFCLQSPMFIIDPGHAQSVIGQLERAKTLTIADFQGQKLSAVQHLHSPLSYPLSTKGIVDGPQFLAETMEDLWNIFFFNNYFYFSRSWTGELRYRARASVRENALVISEIEAAREAMEADEHLPVRQVDFLVKALLYRVSVPAPLPQALQIPDRESQTIQALSDRAGQHEQSWERPNPGSLAFWSLTEYGCWGWYPTFDDSTQCRIR